MSVTIIREVRDYRGELPSTARHVLMTMASHCNHERRDRRCRVSAITLKEETGQDRKTVLRNIATLEAWNMIRTQKSRGSTTDYTLTAASTWRITGGVMPPVTSPTTPPVEHDGEGPVPVPLDEKPVAPCHPTSPMVPPEVVVLGEAEGDRESAGAHATEKKPTTETTSLCSPKKGEKAEPVTMDTPAPAGLFAIVKSQRADLTDAEIEQSFAKFKLKHLGESLTAGRLQGKLSTWLMNERKAAIKEDGQVPGWRTNDRATEAEAARVGYTFGIGVTHADMRLRLERYHETPHQARARTAHELRGPVAFADIDFPKKRDIIGQATVIHDDPGGEE